MKTVKGVDDALRLKIIEEHLAGASLSSLVRKYNLKYTLQIRYWMRNFGFSDYINPVPEGIMRKQQESTEPDELKQLKLENNQLKIKLAQAELKVKAFDTMIDVAEDMFKIPIRKKPGAKQS